MGRNGLRYLVIWYTVAMIELCLSMKGFQQPRRDHEQGKNNGIWKHRDWSKMNGKA